MSSLLHISSNNDIIKYSNSKYLSFAHFDENLPKPSALKLSGYILNFANFDIEASKHHAPTYHFIGLLTSCFGYLAICETQEMLDSGGME